MERLTTIKDHFTGSAASSYSNNISKIAPTPDNSNNENMASTDYKFSGWMGLNKESVKGKLVEQEYEPKPFEETDVDIKITHCGICGSDLHTLRSGWGPTIYPVVVGHEIVGTAVKVGKDVKHVKVGDRVGVGAQSDSCLKTSCEMCTDNNEQYCQNKNVNTYSSKHKNGGISYGGYADYARVPSHFVVQLSDIKLDSVSIAPMLCGGVTLFSPLKRNGCGTTAKRVGIVGVGGLGHFGVMFAKALGAEYVVGISRKANKRDDVLKMGADKYIATDEEEGWAKANANSLDLIISTVSSPKMPLQNYLRMLRPFGTFVQVGAPEDKLPAIAAFSLIGKGVKITGSAIGSPVEIREMVELAAEKGVDTWSNPTPLTKVNDALIAFEEGKPRYRIVLVNEKHAAMP